LAVDTPDVPERLPNPVVEVLRSLNLHGAPVWPLDGEQIRSMTQTDIETHGTGTDDLRRLYEPRGVTPAYDPFEHYEELDLQDTSTNPEQTLRFDRLLGWLSAASEGSWAAFVRVCQMLQLARDGPTARQVFRCLTLLGHVDGSPDGSRWEIAPPALIIPATDSASVFWCGQRTLRMLKQLPSTWIGQRNDQPNNQGPSRVLIRLPVGEEPAAVLRTISLTLRWGGAVASRLAEVLPALDEWQATLSPIIGLTNPRKVERWQENGYVEDTQFYMRDGRYVGESGLYRMTHGEGQHEFQLMCYFDQDRQRLLRGDWYGLRFLALQQAGYPCIAHWRTHDDRTVLVVPTEQRWPLLYERALVLASGMLPRRDWRANLLIYDDIPGELAGLLSHQLGVSLSFEEGTHA